MVDCIWLAVTAATVCVIIYFYSLVRTTSDHDVHRSSLDAFISTGDSSQSPNKKPTKTSRTAYREKGWQILVLFATEYGFSEELANLLVTRIYERCAKIWQPRKINARHYQHIEWDKETICFCIMSTSGDGVPPTESIPFMNLLQRKTEDLQHVQIGILALGDSSYPHFCRAGTLLEQRLRDQGVNFVLPTTKVDGENWTVIESWVAEVMSWINSSAALEVAGQSRHDYLNLSVIDENDAGTFNRSNPFLATVTVKKLLTQVNKAVLDRETIHCELDICGSDLQWTAGDALGICPTNNPGTVDHILSLLGVPGTEKMSPVQKPLFRGAGPLTLKEALLWCYDIKRVTPSTLSALWRLSQGSEVAKAVSSSVQRDEYLELRSLRHVLQDWRNSGHTQLSADKVCSLIQTLRPLQPRFYSISSSPLLDTQTASVTVAVVRYTTEHGEGEGVATTYLQDRLAVGDKCPVFISVNPGFRLPQDSCVPVVCIGAGTGLAPYRAFIQERDLAGANGKVHLYFGCRHPKKDYLYREELEHWEAKGVVRLRVAFSRYQCKKLYVQDLLKEDASVVWTLMQQGAVVYVCGDASHMASDVHQTLLDIVQQQGQLQTAECNDYLLKMEQAGRYQKDVW